MLPIKHFDQVWSRCDHLSVIHAFLSNNSSTILQPDEILRSEWAARVGALDLYIHELIAQRMLEIFEGKSASTSQFEEFSIPLKTVDRIRGSASSTDASAAFDLAVREHLSRKTFQLPEDIAKGVKLFSDVQLWNEVAIFLGASISNKEKEAKRIRLELNQIVSRRNKIVHEGDLQPSVPRTPWPITQSDVTFVSNFIRDMVYAIDSVV